MPDNERTTPEARLNAPTYMRPQRPVLEYPLDLDRGKRGVAPPTAPRAGVVEASENFVTSPIRLTEASLVEAATPPVTAPEVETSVAAPEIPLAEDITPLETAAETAEPISETLVETEPSAEPASEATEEAQPRRKGMSIFQQVIVFLLLLMVTMVLGTVYLYIQGWVELPPSVLEIVEKGLNLIP